MGRSHVIRFPLLSTPPPECLLARKRMSPDLAAAYCDTGGSALRAIRSAFLVAGLLLVSSAPAPAGNNAGASAYLSWDPMDLVTNLPAVPSGPFPLYLRLSGATDISKLAVTL